MPVEVQATLNEVYKGLLLLWNYKFNLVMEAIIICCVFVGLNFLIGNGELPHDQLASTLLGYVIWIYTFMAVSNMGWGIREEIQTGTLEQTFMSPVPPQVLVLGRSLATFISTTVTIVIIGGILMPVFNITIPLRPAGLVVFAWTMIGLWGLGFIVGGTTLIFKHVESMAYMMQYGVMFLNGSLLPVDTLPDGVAVVAKVIPGTQGIIVLRRVVLDGQSLAAAWNDSSLIWLIVHSLLFFAAGWGVFTFCERHVRRRGSLGQY